MPHVTEISVLAADGEKLAPLKLSGDLLPLVVKPPAVVRVSARDARKTTIHIDLQGALTSTGETYCGSLPLTLRDAGRGGISTVRIDVPPPRPWRTEHLVELYEAACALDSFAQALPNTGTAPWKRASPIAAEEGVLMEELGRVRSLAIKWSQVAQAQESSFFQALPRDRAGGRERGLETVRQIGRTISAVDVGDKVIPERTIRQMASTDFWRSDSTAAALDELVSRLEELASDPEAPGSVGPWLTRPLRGAARILRAPERTREPPSSSWPLLLRELRSSTLRALSQLEDQRVIGPDHVPLCPLWKLYELWLARILSQRLEQRFGPAFAERHDTSIVWRWPEVEPEFALFYQPRIPPLDSSEPALRGLRSATATLIPDLLLWAGTGSGGSSVVLDAKRFLRAATAEEVATEGSKYLWGTRRANTSSEVPAIKGVHLVMPVNQKVTFSPEAMIDVITASPGPLTGGLADDLRGALLDGMLISVGLPVA